jgi:hypothetical protein
MLLLYFRLLRGYRYDYSLQSYKIYYYIGHMSYVDYFINNYSK